MELDPMPELAVDQEPFDLDDLDAALDAIEDGTPGPLSVVAYAEGEISFSLAEWTMRHVVALDLNLAQLEQQYAEQSDRIERWHAAARRRLARRREFLADRLEAYAAVQRALDPKNNKTTRLPSGEITSREPKPAPVIEDADAVVEWAEALGVEGLVKIEKKPVAAEVKKLVKVVEVAGPKRVRITLADGDVYDLGLLAEGRDEPGVEVGDLYPVTDGLGEHEEPITDVEILSDVVLAVVDAEGERVPGMSVTPSRIDFTVKPYVS